MFMLFFAIVAIPVLIILFGELFDIVSEYYFEHFSPFK